MVNHNDEQEKLLLQYRLELQMAESAFGLEHPNTATAYNNLGVIKEKIGDYQSALTNHLTALNIREKTLDKTHPDIAQSCNNIASCCAKLGNNKEVVDYFNKAIEIYKAHDMPELATIYGNLGIYYLHIGNEDEFI